MENLSYPYTILNGASSEGFGNYINVHSTDFIVLAVDIDSAATLTVKYPASILEAVDFSSSQSADNSWNYLAGVDLTQVNLFGNTFVTDTSVSSSTAHELIGFDVRCFYWFTAEVSSHTSGSVTVQARTYSV